MFATMVLFLKKKSVSGVNNAAKNSSTHHATNSLAKCTTHHWVMRSWQIGHKVEVKDCSTVWFAGESEFCIRDLIPRLWFNDALELFMATAWISSCLGLFFPVYLKQHQRFSQADVFIFCLISLECWLHGLENDDTACGLVVPRHLIHSEEQEMTVSQSEGSTEMQRGGFLYPVIKFFTKGKQKGHIRGKQLLVCNSRTKWLESFPLVVPSVS